MEQDAMIRGDVGERALVRASEEEVEMAISIALSVTRDMYLSKVTKQKPNAKFDRCWAKDVIAYAVMRQLSRFQFYREPTAHDRADGALPLFEE